MDATGIRQQLKIKGLSLSSVARQIGVSRQTVSVVCRKPWASRPVALALAKALDMPLSEVFPALFSGPARRRGRPRTSSIFG